VPGIHVLMFQQDVDGRDEPGHDKGSLVQSRLGSQLMIEEFKKFALRGNVIDLAIGVIIGAAFSSIVNSLVGDIITPIIGAITGGLDFSNYFLPLSSKVTADTLVEAKKQGAVLGWGSFLTVTINFLIIAFILFLVIRGINRLSFKQKKEEEDKPPPLTKTEELLTEIRDELKSR
jgi:large conductance mechanosensitive channel